MDVSNLTFLGGKAVKNKKIRGICHIRSHDTGTNRQKQVDNQPRE